MIEIIPILFSFFILSAFAQEPPEYSNPYSPIFLNKEVYTWTDKVKITIVAPSWNADRYGINSIGTQDGHFIKISTSEHSLEPYKFTETEPNSGIFTGEVILTGFLHDADGDGDFDTTPRTLGNGPTNGFLETDRGEGITISFEFADGVVLTESALIDWNLGNIIFDKSTHQTGDSAIIKVIDPDMNLNPESLDNVLVEISSDSDVAGILVDSVETDVESGMFEVSVSFTQSLPSSGNRLFALPDDTLYAKYVDYTLPTPYSRSDNLEIQTSSKLESNVPILERLSIDSIFLADSFGKQVLHPISNEQLQVVGKVRNDQQYKQSFVNIIQIKEQDGTVVSLSWIIGELNPNQDLQVSQSWLPTKSGSYVIESFVWNSLQDSVPLSPINIKSIIIE